MISKKHTHQYLQLRKATFPALSTLIKEIGFIKRFFNHCIDMEWINRNPFRSIHYVKADNNYERYYFTEIEIERIMDNANQYNDFYTFLLQTGIRSTDAFALKPKHIKDNYLVKWMNKTGN